MKKKHLKTDLKSLGILPCPILLPLDIPQITNSLSLTQEY